MLAKFLHGLAFGAGFGIAFISLWYVSYFLLLPGLLQQQTTSTQPGTREAAYPSASTTAQVMSVPNVSSRTSYLGSTGVYSSEFIGSNAGILASGPGRITGSVTADGRPVAGLELSLALNGSVMSQWAISDTNGRYSIPVPYGEYRIDGFKLDHASANANLPGMTGHPQSSHRSGNFTVSDESPGRGLDFRFISPVTMNMSKTRYAASEAVKIRWDPYPGASQYMVQVYEKTGPYDFNGNNRLFEWSHRPFVSTTEIDLRDYEIDLKPGYFYAVEINAMDDNMNILSQTARRYSSYDFEINE